MNDERDGHGEEARGYTYDTVRTITRSSIVFERIQLGTAKKRIGWSFREGWGTSLPPIRAFGGERTAEKKNEPREGGDALPDENREEEHRHVEEKASKSCG